MPRAADAVTHEETTMLRIQELLDGWHLQDVANHEDAQDFANAFITAELVVDPAPEGHELSLNDVPLDLVERMAREHWEHARRAA
jgi:hypothetical protein